MAENKLLDRLFKRFLSVAENKSNKLGRLKRILIIRQHNQLGDLLATVSFFRALKEAYPHSSVTLVVSPANCAAVAKNKFIDELFIYDKKKLLRPSYFLKLLRLLRRPYDAAFVPVTVSVSFTSNLLCRLSNSHTRIGVSELNGMINRYDYFFDRRIKMDWRSYPDQNVSDFCLEMLRPFGITTNNYSSEISFDTGDRAAAKTFLNSIQLQSETQKNYNHSLTIGLHVGAGKPPNRWSLDKFVEVIETLNCEYHARFFLTGSSADKREIEYIKNKLSFGIEAFLDRQIPEVAALISLSDLFITNDTGIMHVAGATKTAQVSIFGPTNPFNWAPVGKNKIFLRKSDLIDDVTAGDVLSECRRLLKK